MFFPPVHGWQSMDPPWGNIDLTVLAPGTVSVKFKPITSHTISVERDLPPSRDFKERFPNHSVHSMLVAHGVNEKHFDPLLLVDFTLYPLLVNHFFKFLNPLRKNGHLGVWVHWGSFWVFLAPLIDGSPLLIRQSGKVRGPFTEKWSNEGTGFGRCVHGSFCPLSFCFLPSSEIVDALDSKSFFQLGDPSSVQIPKLFGKLRL